MLGRELLHGLGLSRAPQHRRDDVAGEHAVLDLVPVAQDVVDAEEPRHRLDLVARRRRRQHDRVPSALVGDRRARASRGRSAARSSAGTAARPSRRDPRGRARATPAAPSCDQIGEPGPATEAGADGDTQRADHLGEADLAVTETLSLEVARRVAGDQRPVEVEEGTDRSAPPCSRRPRRPIRGGAWSRSSPSSLPSCSRRTASPARPLRRRDRFAVPRRLLGATSARGPRRTPPAGTWRTAHRRVTAAVS